MHNAHCIYYLISSFIFTLHKPEDDCKVENICLGFSEKISLHAGSFAIIDIADLYSDFHLAWVIMNFLQ